MEHLQPEKRRWNKCNWAQISNSQQELKWASSARNSDGRKSFLDRKKIIFVQRRKSRQMRWEFLDKGTCYSSASRRSGELHKWVWKTNTTFFQMIRNSFQFVFFTEKKLLHFLSVSRQMVRMKSGSIKSIKFHSFFSLNFHIYLFHIFRTFNFHVCC